MLNLGVLVNTVAVIIGSLIGIPLGDRLPQRYKNVLFTAIGAITILLGVQMGIGANDFLVVLISLAVGGMIGELLKIEENITRLANRFSKTDETTFASGFVFATVLFTLGPMTVLGCISAGLKGDNQLLYVKSTMDGISSIILASAYGKGVLAAALGVYLIEGGLVVSAGLIHFLTSPVFINDFTSAGGAILIMIALRLLNVKEIKAGNFLPALVFAPLFDLIRIHF